MIITKAHVTTVPIPSGAGTISMTGITDQSGVDFTPKYALIFGAELLNTIGYNGGNLFADAFQYGAGIDNSLAVPNDVRRGEASSDAAGFGYKISDGASSADYPFINVHAQLSFGGAICLVLGFSAFGSGTASLGYSNPGGYPGFVANRSVIVAFFGGDDLEIWAGGANSPGVETPIGFAPCGIISKPQTLSSGTATGTAGGGAAALGFATSDSGQALAACYTVNQGGVGRVQVTNKAAGNLKSDLTLESGTIAVDSNGYTLSTSLLSAQLAFGGTNLKAYCAAQTQRLTAGTQTVDTDLTNEVIFVVGVGAPVSGSVRTDVCQLSIGIAIPGGNQVCYWNGEVGSNPSSPLGARYISNTDVLRSGTPNGGSTTFSDIIQYTSNDSGTGVITFTVTVASGNANQFIVFALGPLANPTPPASTGQMYKLVPNKTSDTVWLSDGSSEERKIPNPTFITALVGDEDSDA